MKQIVASENDPLSVVVGFVLNEGLDVQTRLSAASVCLPFLFPKLSASTVDAKTTVTHVDASAVLDRLSDRLERLAKPEPPSPVLIEATPEPNDDGAGDE